MLSAQAGVEVVLTRLAIDDEAVRASTLVLSDLEQRRAERLVNDRDRRRFVARRAQLRRLLSDRLGTAPQRIFFSHGEHGKPGLARPFDSAGLRFSLSHCEDFAVYALSAGADVGVDVEAVRALPDADAIAAFAFSRREQEAYRGLSVGDKPLGFLNCWTRKEAFVKATGCGLGHPLDFFDVTLAPHEPPRIVRVNDRAGDDCGWNLASFSAPGLVGALVTERPS